MPHSRKASDSSDPDGSCVATWWDFGDDSSTNGGGSSAKGATASFTYRRQQDMHGESRVPYDVSFTAEDDKGAAKTLVRSVDVTHRSPVVSITATPMSGPAPLTVQFTASVSGTYGMVTPVRGGRAPPGTIFCEPSS